MDVLLLALTSLLVAMIVQGLAYFAVLVGGPQTEAPFGWTLGIGLVLTGIYTFNVHF